MLRSLGGRELRSESRTTFAYSSVLSVSRVGSLIRRQRRGMLRAEPEALNRRVATGLAPRYASGTGPESRSDVAPGFSESGDRRRRDNGADGLSCSPPPERATA